MSFTLLLPLGTPFLLLGFLAQPLFDSLCLVQLISLALGVGWIWRSEWRGKGVWNVLKIKRKEQK